MDTEPLIRAIISALLLLEHSGPDEIDPDLAVKGGENIAYELQKLTAGDRSELLDVLERIADSESDGSIAGFIRSLPFAWGLVS